MSIEAVALTDKCEDKKILDKFLNVLVKANVQQTRKYGHSLIKSNYLNKQVQPFISESATRLLLKAVESVSDLTCKKFWSIEDVELANKSANWTKKHISESEEVGSQSLEAAKQFLSACAEFKIEIRIWY